MVLAYIYPPDSGSGTFRSLYFFNRIAQAGDDVCVVTAREADYALGTPVDNGLRASIDPRIKVVRAGVARPVDWLLRVRSALSRGSGAGQAPTHQVHDAAPSGKKSRLQAFKDLITDSLTFPDHQIGWLPYAYRVAGREIRAARPDCIYSSGGPWTSHLLAVLLKKRYRRPVVLDFRDPWAANPDIAHRSALFRRLSDAAEAFCIRNADQVVLNTPQLREDFIRRYPGQNSTKFTTVTNGFEDSELPASKAASDRFTLVHTGEIYLSRNPASFLRAIQGLIRTGAVPEKTLQVQLVGGCARSPEIDALLNSVELREAIRLIPRVSHKEALEYQLNADVLLLFQMAFPLQVPRKLFEYMSMSKPVLAITELTGATASIVRDSAVGAVAEPEEHSIASALLTLYGAWCAGNAETVQSESVRRYRNSRLAIELRAILHSAAKLPNPAVAGASLSDVD